MFGIVPYICTNSLFQQKNHVIYTNRAQAKIKQNKFQDAIDDCKEAIKLKQDNLKTYAIIVRALRGMKDYQKALDTLEVAEQIPNVDTRLLKEIRQETIKEMKAYLQNNWKMTSTRTENLGEKFMATVFRIVHTKCCTDNFDENQIYLLSGRQYNILTDQSV